MVKIMENTINPWDDLGKPIIFGNIYVDTSEK